MLIAQDHRRGGQPRGDRPQPLAVPVSVVRSTETVDEDDGTEQEKRFGSGTLTDRDRHPGDGRQRGRQQTLTRSEPVVSDPMDPPDGCDASQGRRESKNDFVVAERPLCCKHQQRKTRWVDVVSDGGLDASGYRRSEERRVGKECRSRGSRDRENKEGE